MNGSWSNAGLALEELGSGLQGDSVEPVTERGIGLGKSSKDGGGSGVLRAILNAQAEFGGDNKMSGQLLHLDVGSLRAASVRNGAKI